MPGPAPTTMPEIEGTLALEPLTHCELDGRPVVDGHCGLTSLEQLKEPRRNQCACFTKCESMLKEKLAGSE